MQVDHTTLADLGIVGRDEESLFHQLNFCRTSEGAAYLYKLLTQPLSHASAIEDRQQTLQIMLQLLPQRPELITNGTFMVINKFYDTPINPIDARSTMVGALAYKLANPTDFSHARYVIEHVHNLALGMKALAFQLGEQGALPPALRSMQQEIDRLLQPAGIQQIMADNKPKSPGLLKVMRYGSFIKTRFREVAERLELLHAQLDAYYSLATAIQKFGWTFPQILPGRQPQIDAKALYHPLVPQAVAYDIGFDPGKNFLFLTGANMAGKSTFIKALGLSIYLAHLGMAVPAQSLATTVFQGLLSNIHVVDNIARGESYFFNEVQRIRKTLELVHTGNSWLVLIDELFKGTNVQDAMLCSSTVIEGLRKLPNALFVVSTHLYEIGEPLRRFPNIQFRYFETAVVDDQLQFSYQLKEGISEDRLGYLILKREGVVRLLDGIAEQAQ